VIILLMGVSGAGKTAVGEGLAERTGIPFFDGNDLHSEENIRKMAAGVPLTATHIVAPQKRSSLSNRQDDDRRRAALG
jgi:carbohydrate kinase (thermoresistant glucokinase family)